MEEVLGVAAGLLVLGGVVLIVTWVKVIKQGREAARRLNEAYSNPDRMATPEELDKVKRESGKVR